MLACLAAPASADDRHDRQVEPLLAKYCAGCHGAEKPKALPPLANRYVSVLQRLGFGVDKFGSGTGTLTGPEMVG